MTSNSRQISAAAIWISIACLAPAHGATTWHVDDDNCPGPGTGGPGDPFCTIQGALDAANSGDTVIVADGTYTGVGNRDLQFNGKAIELRSENGAASCVIDCEGQARAFSFYSDEPSGAIVDGFTIVGGGNEFAGGAMIFSHIASPTIKNCVLKGNSATEGGALYLDTSASPTIESCLIEGNSADFGGGFRCFGEGISFARIINSTIVGNEAFIDGGGAYCEGPSPEFVNCVVADNHAARDGGGLFCLTADPVIINCTVTLNSAAVRGGGLVGAGATFNTTVRNSVVWDNSAPSGHEIALLSPPGYGAATLGVVFSNVQGDQFDVFQDPGTALNWDISNQNADPVFNDPESHDFSLAPGSPCIDAGDSTAVPVGISIDLAGNPRFVDVVNYPDLGVPDGSGRVVDIGAFEAPADLCRADITTAGAAPGGPGFGTPDGQVTAADLGLYVNRWVSTDPSADMTTAGAGEGDPGFGVPDGLISVADINFFVNLWITGCP